MPEAQASLATPVAERSATHSTPGHRTSSHPPPDDSVVLAPSPHLPAYSHSPGQMPQTEPPSPGSAPCSTHTVDQQCAGAAHNYRHLHRVWDHSPSGTVLPESS